MSYETDEMFSGSSNKELERVSTENRKRNKEVLEKTKPFKDFIMGREAEWKTVKDSIGLHMYQLPMAGNEVITKDFIAGCRFFAELIDGFASQFDRAFEDLGKE